MSNVTLPYATSYQELSRCQRATEYDSLAGWDRLSYNEDTGVRVFVLRTPTVLEYVVAVSPEAELVLLSTVAYRTVRLHPSLPFVRVHADMYQRFAELIPLLAPLAVAPVPEVRVSGFGVAGSLATLFAIHLRQIYLDTRVTKVFSFGAAMFGYPEVAELVDRQDLLLYPFFLPADPRAYLPGPPFAHATTPYPVNARGIYDPDLPLIPDPFYDTSISNYVDVFVLSRTQGDTGGMASLDGRFQSIYVNVDSLVVPGTGVGVNVLDPEYDLDIDGETHLRGPLIQNHEMIVDPYHNLTNIAHMAVRTVSVADNLQIQNGNLLVGSAAQAGNANARLDVLAGDLCLRNGTFRVGSNVIVDAGRRLSNIATLMAGPYAGRFLVSANGYVGVRANINPRDTLDVFGVVRVQDGLRVRERLIVDAGANMSVQQLLVTQGELRVLANTGDTALCVLPETGFVGVGTSEPTVPFHLVGDCRMEGGLVVEGNVQVNGALQFLSTEVQQSQLLRITSQSQGPAAVINQLGDEPILELQDDGVTVFHVADGGYIGFGTAAPTERLDIHDGGIALQGILVLSPDRVVSNVNALHLVDDAAGVLPRPGGGCTLTVSPAQIAALDIEGATGRVTVHPPLSVEDTLTVDGELLLGAPVHMASVLLVDQERHMHNVASLRIGSHIVLDGQRTLSNLTGLHLETSAPLLQGPTLRLTGDGTLANCAGVHLTNAAQLRHGDVVLLDAGKNLTNLSTLALSGGAFVVSPSEALLPPTTIAGNVTIVSGGTLHLGGMTLSQQGAMNLASLSVRDTLVMDPQRQLSNIATASVQRLVVGAPASLVLDEARALSNISAARLNDAGTLSVGARLVLDSQRVLQNVAGLAVQGPIACTDAVSVGGDVVVDALRNVSNVRSLRLDGSLSIHGTLVASAERGLSNLSSLALLTGAPMVVGSETVLDAARQLRVARVATTAVGPKKLDCGNDLTTQRHVVLHQDPAQDNEHQFYGVGAMAGTLRYQVPALTAAHRFYAASGPTTSLEVGSIAGNGVVTALSHVNTLTGGYQVNAVTVIDADRSLHNVASVNCQAITLRAGGQYGPGSVYSDAAYGMLFRSRIGNPTVADFAFANFNDTKVLTLQSNNAVLAGSLSVGANLHVPGVLTVGAGGLTVDQGNQATTTALQIRESTHVTSRRAAVALGAHWSLLQDSAGSGTRNFAVTQNVANTATLRLGIQPDGRVQIPMGIEVGGALLIDSGRNLQNVNSLAIGGRLETPSRLAAGDGLEIAGKLVCSPQHVVSNLTAMHVGGVARPVTENVTFPSAPLTAATSELFGTPLAGTHIVSASSTSASGNPPFQAFDQSSTTYFESGAFYNASSGQYVGTNTTTHRGNGAVYPGEWLQLALPVPTVVTAFSLLPRQTAPWHLRRAPRAFQLFGSDDGGATWELLAAQTNVLSWTTNGVPLTFSATAGGKAFSFYRLVVQSVGTDGESTSKDYVNLAEMTLSGTPLGRLYAGNDGSVGINTIAPRAALHVEGPALLAGDTTAATLRVGIGAPMVFDRHRNISNVAAVSCAGPVSVGPAMVIDAARNLQNISTLQVLGTASVQGAVFAGPGSASVASATNLQGGAYLRQASWDTASSTHTILFGQYCPGHHVSGFLHVHVSNKNPASPKIGNLLLSFIKAGSASVDVSVVHSHKNAGLSILNAVASGNDVLVYTDIDCSIVWTVQGGF